MIESQKCPLCGGEVHYEHAETIYVCKTYCCPYTADFILHFRVADVLAARDAEIAKLRGLLVRCMIMERTDLDCFAQTHGLGTMPKVERTAARKHVETLKKLKADIRAALKEGGGEE